MLVPYLADKSALARVRHPTVAARLLPRAATAQLATCSLVDLEVRYSARDGVEHTAIRRDRALGYHLVSITQAGFERAIDVQGQLAERGLHRAVAIPDLLIAAVAERAGLVVLHYERDFERIAASTGQPKSGWPSPGRSPEKPARPG